MYGKSQQGFSIFRWITGFLRCCSSNSSPHCKLCRDRSQIRHCLHRGRPQPDSEPSQVQLFVDCHVSLWFYSSLFLFSTQRGTGLAAIPAVLTSKIISSSVALDLTATLATPSTPILSKRARISRMEGKSLGLDKVQIRWTLRRSARY